MASESRVLSVDSGGGDEVPQRSRSGRARPAAVLAVISCGGALGALARYGLHTAFPHPVGGIPWATLGVNASGCLLIGVLLVTVEAGFGPRLLWPFLATGVLGGYTTFSAYAVGVQQAIAAGAAPAALTYSGATVVAAMLAVWAGTLLARGVLRLRNIRGHGEDET